MNPSLQQLAETLLFAESDCFGCSNRPLSKDFDVCDIDKESLSRLHQRFQIFVSKAEAEVTRIKGSNWLSIDDFYTGCASDGFYLEHDYIMTVNGHGCGFWEKDDWEPEIGEALTMLARQEKEINCFVKDDTVFIDF